MNLVTAEHLTKSYTERLLFNDTDFSINEGDKIGLIGINGTGKSTLLKLVAGLEEPDSGTIVRGRNLAIRYLSQNPVFEPGETVLESIIRENDGHDHVWDFEAQAKTMLNKLGITDHNEVVDHLSGGQKKRVALASVLLSTADLLILDEPTNHLDSDMAEWLEDYLKRFRGALLMITHDRYFLDSVTNCIVELDNGKLYRYQANYEGFLELKAERMDMERASERKRQSILRVELEWVKRGARARTTKQKGRLQRYEDLKNQKGPVEDSQVEMESISSRLGRTTVELSDICKSYGDKVLIKDYTYFFLKNDRIGYIGPNGSGKSTLMKIIAGWVQPDSGTVEVGQTVKMGYFSQENEDMDTSLKVIDYIRNVAEYVKTKDGSISASQMLERFLFPPSVQHTVIGKLSGGERRRLYLLKILMDAPNVLILDEPTNDLDIRTLMILEDYLDSFQGIVITVSHDRYFLDRVVRRIFAFEGDGVVRQYEGGFTDYQAKKEAELAAGELGGMAGGAKGSSSAAAGGSKGGFGTGAASAAATGADGAAPAKKTEKPRERKLKFSYAEQREWDTIEDDMAALEEKIADLDTQIAASATNYGKLRELMAEKEDAEAKLEEKMERWMYLNDLAEKIAAQK